MPRPKTPLISRRTVLTVALAIIDADGLDALRIRRLGDELGVNGVSLYHHFKNKDEIVVGAAELALQHVRTPDTRNEDWPVWLKRNNVRTRQALRDHPHLIPVVLSRAPLGIGTNMLESTAALLEDQGVPVEFILPLIEATEMVAISSAMYSHRNDDLGEARLTYHDHPTLLRAAESRDKSEDQLFDDACDAVIASIQRRIADAAPKVSSRSGPAHRRGRRPPISTGAVGQRRSGFK